MSDTGSRTNSQNLCYTNVTSPANIICKSIMGFCHRVLLFLVFLSGASAAQAQSWRILTPRQTLPVPGDGTTVNFPGVDLISGMKYRVHASGKVNVSNGSDISDACYYINIIPIAPPIVSVTLKMRVSPTNENWFYNFWSATGLQSGYQSNHNYDASILSQGSPLSFRFFDRADPPSSYYTDNSGAITVEVARETPGIAIEKDTLNFGTLKVGNSKTLADSIGSYGVEGYNVTNYSVLGTAASKFTVTSQRVPPFTLTEAINEFRITYTPTGNTADSAQLHIFSSNGFGADREKIIYLYGAGIRTNIFFTSDTLDFGTIRTGRTKTLPDSIFSSDNIVDIRNITAANPGSVFTETPAGRSQVTGVLPISVTFAPTTDGSYFERFNVNMNDGTTFYFYAKGVSGTPLITLQYDVLDFGQVILKQSRTLTDLFSNVGKGPISIVSTVNTNPTEYIITGPQGPIPDFEAGHMFFYSIAFSPQTHIPFCGNHDGQFTWYFDDGTSKTLIFKGCDHMPLDARLSIDTQYYVSAGKEIEVSQKLESFPLPFDSTLTPIAQLTETIRYDASLFDLISVSKGALINNNEWNLTTTPSSGAVVILINSATSHFGPNGSLLRLRFRAHDDAKVGQFTDLIQNGINYDPSNLFEPNAIPSGIGRITISDICSPVHITTGILTTSIEQNNPNPFNPSTHIQYAVGNNSQGSSENVRILLFDQLGRFAGMLVNEEKTPGIYDYFFDGSGYSSGAYTYVFQVGDHIERKTMILVK